MCSTGVIGVPIQINDLVKNLPNLVNDLKVIIFKMQQKQF